MASASLLRLVRPAWAAGFAGASLALPDFRNAVPDLAIPPLIPGDRETAHRLYRGEFSFAGHTVVAGPDGIFAAPAPASSWWRALHSFGWLNDLLGSGFELHRAFARAQLQAWHAAPAAAASRRDTAVTARRLSVVAHAWPELLRGASMAFTQDLARIVSRDAAALAGALPRVTGRLDGLLAATALARLVFGFKALGNLRSFALTRLGSELDRFILPDGGPASRNGADLADVLAELVPLRDAMVLARREVPHVIHAAIERAMPMLRFFAHGDGGLGFFQGVNGPRTRILKALLERDTVFGKTFVHAVHSGYVRFQQGAATLLMDVKAGPLAAAPFAFEFSDDAHRVVVNCGYLLDDHPGWRKACCSTAAHSTAMIGEREPGREESFRKIIGFLQRRPARVIESAVETIAAPQGAVLRAEHDGYAATFGLTHQRSVYLAAAGQDLRGEDCFLPADPLVRAPQEVPFVIRFHLHPGVKASLSRDGAGVLLQLPNKAGWQFSLRGGALALEESVYLPGEGEVRPAQQIVVRGLAASPAKVNWAFKALGRPARKAARPEDSPELPF